MQISPPLARFLVSGLAVGIGSVVVAALPVRAGDAGDGVGPIVIAERSAPGDRVRVRATLEAEGRYVPGEGTEEEPAEGFELTVRTRIESVDRVFEARVS